MEKTPTDHIQWIIKLKAIYDNLKQAERKAADFLQYSWKDVITLPIAEAAEAAGCSKATMVRIAKRLGYKGYPDLRKEIVQFSEQKAFPLYPTLKTTDGYQQILQKVYEVTVQTLTDTLNSIDVEDYKKAVGLIAKAKKINFIATGNAVPVAMTSLYKFLRVGLNCTFFDDPDMALVNAKYLTTNDVAIAICYSGRNINTINPVKICKEVGAYVITITNYPHSPLAKISDQVFTTAAFAESLEGDILSERIAQLYMMESIYVGLLLRKKKHLLDNLNTTLDILKINHV